MKKIEVKNLKYRYPLTEELALKGLDFDIEQGEFIGIVGQNGAGKSTLCQALIGLVPHFFKGAYGGSVLINGVNVKESEISDIAQKVGIVFQNPFTQITGAKETVMEELAFGLENLGVEKSEMISRINHAMKLLEIEKLGDKNPFELSGGQMQRVAIASIIAMRPEIIVLDEPTSQLDPQGTEEVFKAIENLCKEGMTIVMVEHKIEKIAEYSDRVMLMDHGEIVAFDTPQKVFSLDNLEDYGVCPPIYTRICQGLSLRSEKTGCYPVTLDETVEEVRKIQ